MEDRRVLALIVLAACGRAAPPAPAASPPAILTDPSAPGADLPRCKTIAVLDSDAGCRVDGAADLDGDGGLDCWRASGDLRIWPGCAGEPIELAIPRAAIADVALPEALEPAARGIAGILVGAHHVSCESPTGHCPAPPPALRWWLERITLPVPDTVEYMGRYTPIWLEGAPARSPREAIVLDPPVTIVVHDPTYGAHDPDVELRKTAACDEWEVWVAPNEAAVVDRATGQWSRIFEGTVGREEYSLESPLADGACAGDVVLLGSAGHHNTYVNAVDPRAGQWTGFGTVEDWPDIFDGGLARTVSGMLSLEQLRRFLATPVDRLPPCADGPLLALPSDAPCTRTGRDDVDGDGTIDCWTATRGVLSTGLQIQRGCQGDAVWLSARTTGVESLLQWEHEFSISPKAAPWIARLFAGAHAGCLPKGRGCPLAGPAARLLRDQYILMSDDPDRIPIVWQEGVPTPPPPSATVIRDVEAYRAFTTILLHHPSAGASLASTGGCERYDLWAGTAGVAAVDRKTGKWAWLQLAAENYFVGGGAAWGAPAPMSHAWCEDGRVAFQFGNGSMWVDPVSGRWDIGSPAGGTP